jgi:hypothetical protein
MSSTLFKGKRTQVERKESLVQCGGAGGNGEVEREGRAERGCNQAETLTISKMEAENRKNG